MDLSSLDQTSNATISISDQLASILTIYKRSRCVKVLVESPVCRDWTAKALRAATNQVDSDTFDEFELHHARKCRFMLFADPWFGRLWTRQEGLYATRLQTVLLDPRGCPRHDTDLSNADKWISKGVNSQQREAVHTFVYDKLQYHGDVKPDSTTSFQAYLDLVYRGELDMRNYQSLSVSQSSPYSPIDSAWRSGRKTTKPQDYVLAVFPDLARYKVPSNARHLSFAELLHNALQQFQDLKCSAQAAVKITKGTLEIENTSDSSMLPFVPESPANITEAYDTFHLVKRFPERDSAKYTLNCGGEDLDVVARDLAIVDVSFKKEHAQELVDLWETSVNIGKHLINCPPSGPCTGAVRDLESL